MQETPPQAERGWGGPPCLPPTQDQAGLTDFIHVPQEALQLPLLPPPRHPPPCSAGAELHRLDSRSASRKSPRERLPSPRQPWAGLCKTPATVGGVCKIIGRGRETLAAESPPLGDGGRGYAKLRQPRAGLGKVVGRGKETPAAESPPLGAGLCKTPNAIGEREAWRVRGCSLAVGGRRRLQFQPNPRKGCWELKFRITRGGPVAYSSQSSQPYQRLAGGAFWLGILGVEV